MKPQFRIPLYYFLFGVTWILVSDRLAGAIVKGPEELALLQTVKGWTFIVVTTLVLHLLIRNHVQRLHAANEAKVESFHRTMRGVQHILNNKLNRLLHLRSRLDPGTLVDEETVRELDAFIHDVSNRITQLSESEEADAAALALAGPATPAPEKEKLLV